jgi:hypothetical protein
MGFYRGPKIVTDEIALVIDAGSHKCYTTGSSVYNIVGDVSASLFNGAYYTSSYGGTFYLDGVNDLIGMEYEIDTSGSYTIQVAAKCASMISDLSPQERQTIFSFNTGTNGYQCFDVEIWNDGVTSFNGDGTSYAAPLNGAYRPMGANDWHLYTVVFNNGQFDFYLDDEFKSTVNLTYTVTSSFFQLGSRGSNAGGTGQVWNGYIGSAKIYNKALTAAEVIQNYNTTISRYKN